MKNKRFFLVAVFFTLFSILLFRNYFLNGQVPFPSNLLVSFYEPWKSYPQEGYPNGPPNKPTNFDSLRIFYPQRQFTTDLVKQGSFPLWNPYIFSGNVHFANYQSAVLAPFAPLFFVLPMIDAWAVMVIIQPVLTGVFTFLFLRELKLSHKASFFGSIVFAFSGWMMVWWQESSMSVYSGLFLPLALFAIEKLAKQFSAKYFTLLTLSLAASVLSGWFQTTLYVFIFAFAYLLYRLKKRFLIGVLAFSLSLLISAVFLLPNFEAYLYSLRGTTDAKYLFDIYLLPLSHIITFFIPDFFGNPAVYNYFGEKGFYYEKALFISIVGLFFGVIAYFSKAFSSEKFFRVAFLTTLSLGFALPTSWFFLYHLNLPFISVIVPSRIFFLSTFSLSVLAAFGIEKFLKEQLPYKTIFILLGVFLLVFVSILSFVFYHMLIEPASPFSRISFRNVILSIAFFGMLFITLTTCYILKRKVKIKRLTNVAFLAFVAISLLFTAYFANKYLTFSERRFVYPEVGVISYLSNNSEYSRVLGYKKAHITSNLLMYYGIFSANGYDSIYIQRYGELMSYVNTHGELNKQIPRADATLLVENEKDFQSNIKRRLMYLLGIKYLIVKNTQVENLGEIDNISKVWSDEYFTVFKNELALPRAFIAYDYVVAKKKEVLSMMFSKDIDVSKTVILEEDIKLEEGTSSGSAKFVSYKPNEISIITNSDKEGLLFLSDNFYPGWRVYVNGNPEKIYRADYSFRAVKVPEGKTEVEFVYEPEIFTYGVVLSFTGLVVLLVISVAEKRYLKKR